MQFHQSERDKLLSPLAVTLFKKNLLIFFHQIDILTSKAHNAFSCLQGHFEHRLIFLGSMGKQSLLSDKPPPPKKVSFLLHCCQTHRIKIHKI